VAAHVHESPPAMRTPLMVLAVLSIVGGLLGIPPENGLLHRFLAPVFHDAIELSGHHHQFAFIDIMLMLVSLAIAVGGWRLAYRFYVQDPQKPEEWAQRWPTFYNLSVNKYFVDEGYAKGVVTPIYNLSVGLWRVCDDRVIDFIVNLVANMIVAISEAGRRVMQTGYVRTYALWMAIGALCVMWFIV